MRYTRAQFDDISIANDAVDISNDVLSRTSAKPIGVVTRTVVVAVPGVVHASGQDIVACTAVQRVGSVVALQRIVAITPKNHIITGTT